MPLILKSLHPITIQSNPSDGIKNPIRLRISPDYIDYDDDLKALYEEE